MHVVSTAAQARAILRALPRPLGFVPTMGALHDGHLELVRSARSAGAAVAASIFVNPLQFGANEDLASYPRDFEGDREKLARGGVDLLFAPTRDAMYPSDFTTFVDVGALGSTFEGAIRPEHFRGVATVVAKLLGIVQPDVLYLGQKDAQQTAVLRKMVRELDFAVRVEVVPTVRERDGLAMSSRNAYLSERQRADATSLQRALLAMRDALARGDAKADAITLAQTTLSSSATPDYFDLVDADTFERIDRLRPPAFVIGAAHFGPTRLLDNLWVPT